MDVEKLEKIKSRLTWDFKFEDEFKTKNYGYTFIIDVLNGVANLSLYRFSEYGCRSEPIEEKQPAIEMLNQALAEQGNESMQDGFYYVNEELKNWVEKEVLEIA